MVSYTPGRACGYDQPERWYMLWYYDDNFVDGFEEEMRGFWDEYTGKEWSSDEERIEAARRKCDMAMLNYLPQLGKYEAISRDICNQWKYPTKEELRARTKNLRSIVAECKKHTGGKYADRWCLLEMRANMLLHDYQANVNLWETRGEKAPESCYKRMMRNIYANALLNTGRKEEAWDIYADQQDVESLIWSVYKYTNLAGIKKIYSENPNAKVLEYMLQRYVNEVQDVVDCYDDGYNMDYAFVDDAYAHISPDYMHEIRDFADFALKVVDEGKTKVPGLWMTCAAIVDYYLKDYAAAKAHIDQAMSMSAPEEVKKATRRIRMLIEPEVADVNSAEFRTFMAEELKWLDDDIARTKNVRYGNARDRILNLGLSRSFSRNGDKNAAIVMQKLRNYNPMNLMESTCGDYSSVSFSDLWRLSGDQLVRYFHYFNSDNHDPLIAYAKEIFSYSPDYVNDLIGTKYLAECNYARALPFLQAVSQPFLDRQAIAEYAACRDYHIPAWNGFQSTGRKGAHTKLAGNKKLDYCKDMISLENRYANATGEDRLALAYEMATCLYQASLKGQCWFLTNYGTSNYIYSCDEDEFVVNPERGESYRRAMELLKEAEKAVNPETHASVLFALVYLAPDRWCDTEWRWNDDGSSHYTIVHPKRQSEQYKRLQALLNYLPYAGKTAADIQRCDVVRQFRAHR